MPLLEALIWAAFVPPGVLPSGASPQDGPRPRLSGLREDLASCCGNARPCWPPSGPSTQLAIAGWFYLSKALHCLPPLDPPSGQPSVIGKEWGWLPRLEGAKVSDPNFPVSGAHSCTGPQGTLSAGTTCVTTKLESASTRQTQKATAPKTACTALLPTGRMTSAPLSTTSGGLDPALG